MGHSHHGSGSGGAETMLVSAVVDDARRAQMGEGSRPWPEYAILERDHGFRILDWSQLQPAASLRTPGVSLRHVRTALAGQPVAGFLSDGEHLGMPLGAALGLRRARPRHVVIVHHVSSRAKRLLMRNPLVRRGVDVFVVHSLEQQRILVDEVGLPAERVQMIRYGVDTGFWSPQEAASQERLVAAAGLEHRDYATLASAAGDLDAEIVVAAASAHSPRARHALGEQWPANMSASSLDAMRLRELYARASVIAVPVQETDFPAGITVLLEAMAMGRPVVATRTRGLAGAVADAGAVLWVPPGDAGALRAELDRLLADADLRAALGARARESALAEHGADRFAKRLAQALAGENGQARDA